MVQPYIGFSHAVLLHTLTITPATAPPIPLQLCGPVTHVSILVHLQHLELPARQQPVNGGLRTHEKAKGGGASMCSCVHVRTNRNLA